MSFTANPLGYFFISLASMNNTLRFSGTPALCKTVFISEIYLLESHFSHLYKIQSWFLGYWCSLSEVRTETWCLGGSLPSLSPADSSSCLEMGNWAEGWSEEQVIGVAVSLTRGTCAPGCALISWSLFMLFWYLRGGVWLVIMMNILERNFLNSLLIRQDLQTILFLFKILTFHLSWIFCINFAFFQILF